MSFKKSSINKIKKDINKYNFERKTYKKKH